MKVLHRLHVYYIYLEFIDNLIENYGIKRIRDKLEALDESELVETQKILEIIHTDGIISTKVDTVKAKRIAKLIEDNVLRQIGAKYKYTWHSPIINSGYEICTIYNNTIIYNNL